MNNKRKASETERSSFHTTFGGHSICNIHQRMSGSNTIAEKKSQLTITCTNRESSKRADNIVLDVVVVDCLLNARYLASRCCRFRWPCHVYSYSYIRTARHSHTNQQYITICFPMLKPICQCQPSECLLCTYAALSLCTSRSSPAELLFHTYANTAQTHRQSTRTIYLYRIARE